MKAAAVVLALAFAPWLAVAADAPRDVHGSGDIFGAPGVALAWSVLRGANETATSVVVAIATDPATYPRVAAVGIDPFTKAERTLHAAASSAGRIDVRIPRAQFGDYPRTEFRFYPSAAATQPTLVVFYHGVPDTTPEFVDAAKLAAHLVQRLADARAAGGKAP